MPTYQSGEVWTWFNGYSTNETIIQVFPKTKYGQQVLTQDEDGFYHTYTLDRFGYAQRGNPELRIRIS
jgi:hypothetical protein